MIHLSPSFPQGSRSKLRARTVSYLTPGKMMMQKRPLLQKVIICLQKTPLLPERLPLTDTLIFHTVFFFSLLTFFHIT